MKKNILQLMYGISSPIRSLISIKSLSEKVFNRQLICLALLIPLFTIPNESQAQPRRRVAKIESLVVKQPVVKECDNSVKVITFTGQISVNRPCVVTYKWLRSDGGIGLIQNIVFSAAGIKTVSTTWSISHTSYDGWQALEINNPNKVTSDKAYFSITCCKKESENNCSNNPYAVNACALDLLNTFKKLVKGTGTRICNTNVGSLNISSAMNLSCYLNQQVTVTGIATYTSFYIPSDSVFRVVWGSAEHNNLAYNYYGACSPEPIVFPEGLGQNHVYAAFLIPVEDYKATADKGYYNLRTKAIRPTDIADLEGWYYEPKSGYISTTEIADYEDIFSSKGLVVKTRMKSGIMKTCYLINNYDKTVTLTWKDANMCFDDNISNSEGQKKDNKSKEARMEGAIESGNLEPSAVLDQNNPNPFSDDTDIWMTLPTNTKKAFLEIYSLEGLQLKSIEISDRGHTSVKISGNELHAGMYVYSLVLDGEVIDTKKMVLTK